MVMLPDCGSTFCAVPPLSSVTAAVVRTSALVSGERANSRPNRCPITLHQQHKVHMITSVQQDNGTASQIAKFQLEQEAMRVAPISNVSLPVVGMLQQPTHAAQ
jgi:hypothetical protein